MSIVGNNLSMISNDARGIHVLLVDPDVPSLADITRKLEFFSYQVIATTNGGAALAILRSSAITVNLILTNVDLPDLNGFDILNEAVKKKVPIIMMSENEDMTVKRMALEYGARFFLRKPLTSDDVKELWQYTVKSQIIERRQVTEGNFSIDNIIDNGDSSGLTRTQVSSHLQNWRDGNWEGFLPVVPVSGSRELEVMPIFANQLLSTNPSSQPTIDQSLSLDFATSSGRRSSSSGKTDDFLKIRPTNKKCRDGKWEGLLPVVPVSSSRELGVMPIFANQVLSINPLSQPTTDRPLSPDFAASSARRSSSSGKTDDYLKIRPTKKKCRAGNGKGFLPVVPISGSSELGVMPIFANQLLFTNPPSQPTTDRPLSSDTAASSGKKSSFSGKTDGLLKIRSPKKKCPNGKREGCKPVVPISGSNSSEVMPISTKLPPSTPPSQPTTERKLSEKPKEIITYMRRKKTSGGGATLKISEDTEKYKSPELSVILQINGEDLGADVATNKDNQYLKQASSQGI